MESFVRIALLSAAPRRQRAGANGWHVRDLIRAATLLGHRAEAIDFCRVCAHVGGPPDPLSTFDTGIVRDDVTLAGLTGLSTHRSQGSAAVPTPHRDRRASRTCTSTTAGNSPRAGC